MLGISATRSTVSVSQKPLCFRHILCKPGYREKDTFSPASAPSTKKPFWPSILQSHDHHVEKRLSIFAWQLLWWSRFLWLRRAIVSKTCLNDSFIKKVRRPCTNRTFLWEYYFCFQLPTLVNTSPCCITYPASGQGFPGYPNSHSGMPLARQFQHISFFAILFSSAIQLIDSITIFNGTAMLPLSNQTIYWSKPIAAVDKRMLSVSWRVSFLPVNALISRELILILASACGSWYQPVSILFNAT